MTSHDDARRTSERSDTHTPHLGDHRYIGRPMKRREDPRLVTGGGRYVDDLAPPGCLHVVFARSADDWLVKRVRAAGEPVCVVTSDRQLADRARRRGAEVVSPRRFLARCGQA